MWEWTLNWNQMRDNIVIGSCPMAPEDLDRIHGETGATALLSLQSDQCRSAFGIDYETHRAHGDDLGLAMVNAPMLDFNPPDQRRNLPEAVHRLHELVSAGHKVYVHCTAGINRAPLAVLGYLSFVETVTPDTAIAIIRQVRPEADPSWEAYHGCREDLVGALLDHIRLRAFDMSRQHPHGDPDSHWFEAEKQVIRDAFTNPRALNGWRLDPSRS
jgi:atypical dual specificity phosphatase